MDCVYLDMERAFNKCPIPSLWKLRIIGRLKVRILEQRKDFKERIVVRHRMLV